MNYLGIDLHKRESQVAIVDQDGEIQREVHVENANLDALTEEYAGNEAAIEATGNYFTVYDALDEHLNVGGGGRLISVTTRSGIRRCRHSW